MEYDTENHTPGTQLSTRARTVWNLTSERPADGATAVAPLLFADYDAPVDLHNRARSSRLGLTFHHQPGADESPVKDVAPEVSYDDGATWQAVRRLRDKGKSLTAHFATERLVYVMS
ncbi:hypothetical protein FHR32_008788 [Streptosporangium album]|uniref:Uncharacterized protein n=1 Tax=Streptosporangium album TaxID=47479 RepID=A0A7W7WE52_9ACTN|nr:hypothetical protein [Streptosporangium album]MBB4944382.1 hypothetical protein [Streptosporangium album]